MNYPRLFSLAIVSVCLLVPLKFADAKPAKGKPSQKRTHDVDQKKGHKKFHDKQQRKHDKFHEKNRKHHGDRRGNRHGEDHGDYRDKDHVSRHDKFHDKQQRKHDKFHDKHRKRHGDRHGDDHDDYDDNDHVNRHDRFHDKHRRRHGDRHEDDQGDDHDDYDDNDHVNRHDKFHDKQQRRHEDFHEKRRERHEDDYADDRHNDHDADDDHRDDYRRDRDRRRSGEDDRPWQTQRQNEERKLQHRLDQAEHLRQISERNGNPRLAETADRMEQKALEHYDKRLQRIDQHQNPDTQDGFAEQAPSPTGQHNQARSPTAQPPRSSLSQFNDRFQQQLVSEQRELRQRLDTADRLRQLGEQNGDPQLLEKADRIEDSAFERFDQRIQRLGEPLTPDQQSQLNDYYERSVTDVLERESDRMVRQGMDDVENAILDQPVRRLMQDVRYWIGR